MASKILLADPFGSTHKAKWWFIWENNSVSNSPARSWWTVQIVAQYLYIPALNSPFWVELCRNQVFTRAYYLDQGCRWGKTGSTPSLSGSSWWKHFRTGRTGCTWWSRSGAHGRTGRRPLIPLCSWRPVVWGESRTRSSEPRPRDEQHQNEAQPRHVLHAFLSCSKWLCKWQMFRVQDEGLEDNGVFSNSLKSYITLDNHRSDVTLSGDMKTMPWHRLY